MVALSSRHGHCRFVQMFAFAETQYARIQFTFFAVESATTDYVHYRKHMASPNIIRIEILTKSGPLPFRILFWFHQNQLPLARIAYHTTTPNDSQIFRIATSGTVRDLIRNLGAKGGSLSDCDQQGRTLLNVMTIG